MMLKRLLPVLSAVGLFMVLSCTAMEPYDYENERDQKPGPGLFSGENGAFTIYQSPEPNSENGKTTAAPVDEAEKKEDNTGG